MDPQVSLSLREHQVRALEAYLAKAQGFCNFSQMGTGKTLVALAAMNILRQKAAIQKVLIVCPNTLKYAWRDEFAKSLLKWHPVVLEGHSSKRLEAIAEARPHTVIITNYESLVRLAKAINLWMPEMIVCDELHAVKHWKAQKTKALKTIKCSYKMGLTGTPMPNNPLDVWSQMDWVRPGHLGPNFFAFRNRYAVVYTGAGFPMIRSFKNLPELAKRVGEYSFRVTKEECLDLPPKEYQEIEVVLSPEEARAYKDMATHMIAEIGETAVAASTALVRIGKLSQITSGFINHEDAGVLQIGTSKLDALDDLLDSLSDQKVVVWCRYRQELEDIRKRVESKGRPCVQLHGDVAPQERKVIEDGFRDSKDPVVLAGIIRVGGVGMNLQSASYCVFYSNEWSLGDRMQAEDRIHRDGQTRPVNYYDLVVRGSIDSYVIKVLKKKEKMADVVTGDELRKILFDK